MGVDLCDHWIDVACGANLCKSIFLHSPTFWLHRGKREGLSTLDKARKSYSWLGIFIWIILLADFPQLVLLLLISRQVGFTTIALFSFWNGFVHCVWKIYGIIDNFVCFEGHENRKKYSEKLVLKNGKKDFKGQQLRVEDSLGLKCCKHIFRLVIITFIFCSFYFYLLSLYLSQYYVKVAMLCK